MNLIDTLILILFYPFSVPFGKNIVIDSIFTPVDLIVIENFISFLIF